MLGNKNKRSREIHQPNDFKNTDMAAPSEKKTSIKLSLFVGFADSFSPEGLSKSTTAKSPRNFDDGTVGLGIVAAMSDPGETRAAKIPRPAIPPRSVPIPIGSVKTGAGYGRYGRGEGDEKEEEMELSESYTCVISHVGGKSVRKRVYFDNGMSDGIVRNYWGNPGEDFESPPSADLVLPATDFLYRCYLCRKKLHGLDIFMYRGDKAFCSADCRHQQIAMDEQIEKYGSGKLKPFDYSVSPYPAPLNYAAGVAAA